MKVEKRSSTSAIRQSQSIRPSVHTTFKRNDGTVKVVQSRNTVQSNVESTVKNSEGAWSHTETTINMSNLSQSNEEIGKAMTTVNANLLQSSNSILTSSLRATIPTASRTITPSTLIEIARQTLLSMFGNEVSQSVQDNILRFGTPIPISATKQCELFQVDEEDQKQDVEGNNNLAESLYSSDDEIIGCHAPLAQMEAASNDLQDTEEDEEEEDMEEDDESEVSDATDNNDNK